MERSAEEIGRTIKQAVDVEIDALVEWCKSRPAPSMAEIEERVLALRRVVGEKAAEAVVEGQANRYPAEARCPRCGGITENKGLKELTVQSSCGEIKIERGYWYCPTCKEGFFPPR